MGKKVSVQILVEIIYLFGWLVYFIIKKFNVFNIKQFSLGMIAKSCL